jgi:2-oxoglutarate ferredoxin oxidoreductase subunit delta
MEKILDERLKRVRTDYIWANPRLCEACWECISACPQEVIGKVGFLWHKHIVFKNSDSCIGCRKCIKVCPNGVFTLSKE